MDVSENNDPKTLKAAQVSVGMFGVLTEITLKVENKFRLKEIRTHEPLDYCLDNLDALVHGEHIYVKMWIEFYHGSCILFKTTKTTEKFTEEIPWYISFLTVSSQHVYCTTLYHNNSMRSINLV